MMDASPIKVVAALISDAAGRVLLVRKRGTSDISYLEKLICPKLHWTRGIPLHAKGFICERYEKG